MNTLNYFLNARKKQAFSNGTKLMLLFLFCFNYPTLFAQSFIPPDYHQGEFPSPNMHFYPNEGQVIDTDGNLRPDIQYYTLGGAPGIYTSNESISMTMQKPSATPGAPDDVYRLDILPYKAENTPEVFEIGESDDHVNFYYPHCAQGITNVHGYERIIYENYFDGIDMHLTSNANGLKTFFVVHPGADPGDIQLELKGQSTLSILLNGNLRCYMGQDYFEIPQAIAYEVDGNGDVTGMTWTPSFYSISSDIVGFHTGSYDTGEFLVFEIAEPTFPTGPNGPTSGDNRDWVSYYGGISSETAEDVTTDNNKVYMVGKTGSTNFPITIGTGSFNGGSDAFIVRFDEFTFREWATYFGGSGTENAPKIVFHNDEAIIAGNTSSANFPLKDNGTAEYDDVYDVTTNNDPFEVFIVKMDKNTGITNHATYWGEDGTTTLGDLEISQEGRIYVVGSGHVPTTTGVPSVVELGFISMFNSDLVLVESSQFGTVTSLATQNAPQLVINAVDIDRFNNIYIGGNAKNGNITPTPANFNTMQFNFGNNAGTGVDDAFLAKLDNNFNLVWSTYFGGSGNLFKETITDLRVSPLDFVLVCGQSDAINLPLVSGSFQGGLDGFVLKMDLDGLFDVGTYIGTAGLDRTAELALDKQGNYYVVGDVEFGFPATDLVQQFPNDYQQTSNGATEVYIAAFNINNAPSVPVLEWLTNFGGNSIDKGSSITISDDDKLYITGTSPSNNAFPWKDPLPNNNANWFEDNLSGGSDAFIAKFNLGLLSNTNQIRDINFNVHIAPNIITNQTSLEIKSSAK